MFTLLESTLGVLHLELRSYSLLDHELREALGTRACVADILQVFQSHLLGGLGQMTVFWCAFVFAICRAHDNSCPCFIRCEAVIDGLIVWP